MADPTLYLYTSLTAGSSHIITATSRMETILKANKLPFRAIDCATDEKARQLWGRRSRGKKIPGLVKYGQVIADLEQVEEWNEFGELVEQIEDVSDIFGDTPMTDTPLPPPVNTLPPNPLKPIVETPAGMAPQISRSSSETRHISIAEPADKKDKSEANTSAAPKGVLGATPLAMALRQAGVEAAAKAGQKKASAVAALKSEEAKTTESKPAETVPTSKETDSTPTIVSPAKKTDSSETTPNPEQTKPSPDAVLESMSEEEKKSVTAAKTPAQLEAEGVRKVSVDKTSPVSETAAAADTSDVPPVDTNESTSETLSTEEQVLDRQRTLSIAKKKSSLSKETSVDEVSSEDDDNEAEEKNAGVTAAAQAVANVKREESEEKSKASTTEDSIPEHEAVTTTLAPSSSVLSTDDVSTSTAVATGIPTTERLHRGSSLSEAPDEEIKEIERKNVIMEESEEDEDEDDDQKESQEGDNKPVAESKKVGSVPQTEKQVEKKPDPEKTTTKVSATDEQEETVTEPSEPQETKPADPNDAVKSVGD